MMKLTLKLLLASFLFIGLANAKRYEFTGGGQWATQYKAGDTLVFKAGNYTYFSGEKMNGDSLHPIVCLFEKGAFFTNGFNLTDCDYWKFDGGADSNIVIKNNTSGVAFFFKGKSGHIEINGARVDNCYSFLWFKTDPGEPALLNWNYWRKTGAKTSSGIEIVQATYVMTGIKITNSKFTNLGFDAGYVGNTQQGDFTIITINGVKYAAMPAPVKDVIFQNVVIENSKRTGLQISGLIGGEKSFLKNVTICNSGTGKEQYQGANFRIGGNSSGGFTLDSCNFDKSWMANIHSQGGGIIIMKNCSITNSCIGNEKMAAVWFDSYASYPVSIKFSNNKIDKSNNNVSVVVYGNSATVKGIDTCGNKFEGAFQNATGLQVIKCNDTITTEPPIPPTPVLSPIKSIEVSKDQTVTFFREDGTKTVIDNAFKALSQQTKKGVIKWYYTKVGETKYTEIK